MATMTYHQKVQRLQQLVQKAELSAAMERRAYESRGQRAAVRHKCFITYHGADIDAVTSFVDDFNDVFIPRVVGVSDSDQFKEPVNSTDEDYIKSQIGAKYLADSSVTILYVGKCAWARRYIDWELSSTMRDDPVNKRNGLMGITPPDRSSNLLPARFNDNLDEDGGSYARYYYYPTTETDLRSWIEDAFAARISRAGLIQNGRALRKSDSPC